MSAHSTGDGGSLTLANLSLTGSKAQALKMYASYTETLFDINTYEERDPNISNYFTHLRTEDENTTTQSNKPNKQTAE